MVMQQEARTRTDGSARDNRQSGDRGMGRALGWFSIGLGLAQLAAPDRLASLIGLEDDDRTRNLMRAVGFRELATGVGLLRQPDDSRWLWARAAGDAVDLALLGTAMGRGNGNRARLAAATAAVVGVAALDVWSGAESSDDEGILSGEPIRVKRAITIRRSPDEVYAFWRDLTNLPRFMSYLESVEELGNGRSRWRAAAPAGTTVEWEAEITEDRRGEVIAWRSVGGTAVPNEGEVRFRRAPGDQGTEVHVTLGYLPPGGRAGAFIAKLTGRSPGEEIPRDLGALKQLLETGEVARASGSLRVGQPGQPPAEPVTHEYAHEA